MMGILALLCVALIALVLFKKRGFLLERSGTAAGSEAKLVSDLDRMLTESIAFKLHGKVHRINPITVEEFYKFTKAFSLVGGLKAEGISPAEAVTLYHEVISSVAPSVSRKDIEGMTQAQVGALLQLVIEAVTGKAYTEVPQVGEGEKKN